MDSNHRERGHALNDQQCPECDLHLGIDPGRRPVHAVCRLCAAIAVLDERAGCYRMPRTQEWLDLCLFPGWYDLLEERDRILETITGPRGQPPDPARPPAAPIKNSTARSLARRGS